MSKAKVSKINNGNNTNNNNMNVSDLPIVLHRFSIHAKAERANVKDLSREIEADNESRTKTVSTSVRRIPAEMIKPVTSAQIKIRNHFASNGIQMGSDWAIPIAIMPTFKAELDRMIQEFDLAKTKLVEAAENGDMQRQAEMEMAKLKTKYAISIPSADDIREGFGIDIVTSTNFESPNVRSALGLLETDIREKIEKEIRESMEKDNAEKLAAGSMVIRERIKTFLNDFESRVGGEPKGVHFKTIVETFGRLVSELPKFNLTNDPEIDALIAEFRTKLDGLNPIMLKHDATTRTKAVESAKAVKTKFAKMF